MAKPKTYRTIDGHQYMLASHADQRMLGMTNDCLELAAEIASQWFATGDDGLSDTIRSMKQD